MKPLDLMLVSGRHFNVEQRRQAVARDRCVATDLAERGCVVRWVYPEGDGHDEIVDGVSLLPVRTVVPGFSGVEARLDDPPLEQALSRSVRADLPDVVHVLGYGAGTSTSVPWVADRMGVPCVVTLKGKEMLCHRGTLVNEHGKSCSEWNRAERCAECCLTPFAGGLGPAAAAFGRLLARLQWISPFPQEMNFQNRLELVTAGLMTVQRVVVTTIEDVGLLQQAGVKGPVECLQDACDADALMDMYQAVRSAES
jgi:hypothetical protein